MDRKLKINYGLILSVLVHILLILLALFVFDRDRYDMKEYQKTQTKGYTVQLVDAPNTPNPQAQTNSNSSATSGLSNTQSTKEQINFKDSGKGKTKDDSFKGSLGKSREAKKSAKNKSRSEARKSEAKSSAELIPIKGEKTAKIDKRVILQASAPIVDYSKEGSGDKIDASTDGNGTQSGVFDLRRVEYGQKVAYAVRQNIVPPPGYNGTVLPYRAYVTLDQNMQFVKMQVVQSTGDTKFDINIAKALRETIYPPLPAGADWRYYHNIDFTIHQQ